MDQYDYRIESLGAIFAKHAEKAKKMQEELIKKYRENYPEVELPEHFQDTFNINTALSVMACEIEKLKRSLR